jgi:WS/DGAT/MGAT family acyltransferase
MHPPLEEVAVRVLEKKKAPTHGNFARLSSLDRMFLRLESAAWQCHFGGLAVVEGQSLLDAAGQLRLPEIMERLDRRVSRVPELRRRVYFPGPFRGGPLWVDDPEFDIRHHVHETCIEPPGGDRELLDAAARLYGGLLDRNRPLWELWFLTGLTDRRIGVLLKLHHAVADGMAAVAIMGSLFDFEPDAPEPASEGWTAEPIPTDRSLLADNVSRKIRILSRAPATLGRFASRARGFARVARRGINRMQLYRDFGLGDRPITAPPTWLNQAVRAGRRVHFLRLDLSAMKQVANAREGKVNDVVIDLWLGGLRQLLLSRGAATDGVELMIGVPVSLRSATSAAKIDNQTGNMLVPFPVWEADVHRRLELIVARTRRAKAQQHPAAVTGFLVGLAATPIGKYLSVRQRSTNQVVTNVVGPPVPVYMLGARIVDILPIVQLIGNIGLTLCAFSYSGRMYLVVTADASAFPDLEVLMAGMERDWNALIGSYGAEPARASA